jgi:hypothetical protein
MSISRKHPFFDQKVLNYMSFATMLQLGFFQILTTFMAIITYFDSFILVYS